MTTLLSRSHTPGEYDHNSNRPGLLTSIPGVHIGVEGVETEAGDEGYIEVGELLGNWLVSW